MIVAKGSSWDGAANGTSDVFASIASPIVNTYTVSGAIGEKNGQLLLDNADSTAITMTLSAPTAGNDDGKVLSIHSLDTLAHKVIASTVGFNAKGSDGTATWDTNFGSGMRIMAYNGNWIVDSVKGVTIS